MERWFDADYRDANESRYTTWEESEGGSLECCFGSYKTRVGVFVTQMSFFLKALLAIQNGGSENSFLMICYC